MEFKSEINDGVCEAVVEGELTIYHVNEFKKGLEKAIKKSSTVNLNLGGVSEIDTAGFQLLMQAQTACLEDDKEFHLVSVSRAVAEVMDIFGLEMHFGEFERVAAN